MSEVVKNAIKKTKEVVPQLNSLNDDLMFGIIAYRYFYNEGHFDKSDFEYSYVDGANDGGVDLIAVEETDMSKNLVLIQSKNVSSISSKDQIKDIFTKMAQTVIDFKDERVSSYNDRLRRIYREKYDYSYDDINFNIKLVLFLGLDKDESYKEMIMEHLSKIDLLDNYEVLIYYLHDVEQAILTFENGFRFVPEGKINIYKEDGIIKCGDNGILVNISALSLRKLYDLYKDNGLFEQNFRYFIRNKKIDSEIQKSLKGKRQKFWFLNNGIIIGCKNFNTDGDNIKLQDFSIVNGCQTTSLIGTYKGANDSLDFPIPCKIIKPDKGGDDYFNTFISEIAESSNSQKPISDRDLKSNSEEQRRLQSILAQGTPEIYLEIKRGENLGKKKNCEAWQKIKNDQLGQYILACLLQQPGTARSAKSKIFADKTIYNNIFKLPHDKETIVDLLRLGDYYDSFVSNNNLDNNLSVVAKNGKYCILATICFLVKYKRKLLDLALDAESGAWASDVMLDNIRGPLFCNLPDNYVVIINSIFNDLVNLIYTLFNSLQDSEGSVTNFLKKDKTYHSIILNRVKSTLLVDEYNKNKIFEKMDQIFI